MSEYTRLEYAGPRLWPSAKWYWIPGVLLALAGIAAALLFLRPSAQAASDGSLTVLDNGRTTQVANLRSDRSYALRTTQRWTYAEDVQTCQVTGGSGPAFDVPLTAKGSQSFRPPRSVSQAQIDCPDGFALTQLGPPLFSGIGIVLLPGLIFFGAAGLIGWYGIRRSRLTPEATD